MKKSKLALFIGLVVLSLSSCSHLSEKLTLKEQSFSDINGWRKDSHTLALQTFLQSCEKFMKIPDRRNLHPSELGGKYENWHKTCKKARIAPNAKHFFESNFTPYLASNRGDIEGLFTGYYETSIRASRSQKTPYIYPIYRKPGDLQVGKEYFTRKQINDGALEKENLELFWTDDPVALFFLHVQGSGTVQLDDGTYTRIGFAAKNGHEYFSIGRYLIQQGEIAKADVSADSIKKWLKDNPNKMMEVLEKNQSYIFFREIEDDGAIGAQGVPLTPLRSIAVDNEFIPYGIPVWVNTRISNGNFEFKRLMIAQDTGSAIKGPVRADIFFGNGTKAAQLAGHQNSTGFYYLLLPNGIRP